LRFRRGFIAGDLEEVRWGGVAGSTVGDEAGPEGVEPSEEDHRTEEKLVGKTVA
jgi:hypothetical protein